jgi:hypothetical protein
MHMEYSKVKINHLIHKKQTKNAHLYENEIHPTWTPIKPIYKDIQIGSKSFHIIRITQFQFNWLHHVGQNKIKGITNTTLH